MDHSMPFRLITPRIPFRKAVGPIFYFTFLFFHIHSMCARSIRIEHLPSRYGQSVSALVYATVFIREAHMADPNPSKW